MINSLQKAPLTVQVCLCLGTLVVSPFQKSCAFHSRCQYLVRSTCKSHLCEIPLVQCDTCSTAWAKPVGLQRRSFLCDSCCRDSPWAQGVVADASSWWFDGDAKLSHFIFKQLSFSLTLHASSHKVCCICPLNPFCLYFSRGVISCVIIYKAV